MNKFTELAERVSRTRQAWNDKADGLAKRLDKLDPIADAAFAKHHSDLDAAEAGIKEMEDAARDLAGANLPPLEAAKVGSALTSADQSSNLNQMNGAQNAANTVYPQAVRQA